MAVFFIYVPDGGTFSMDDMEFSPNAELVRRQLASRVRTGEGKSHFISKMEGFTHRASYDASAEDEWPEATEDAHMVVWRCKGKETPSGPPTEVWYFSGSVDRPRIVPVSQEPKPEEYQAFGESKTLEEWLRDKRLRVSVDDLHRRLKMGWEFERALGSMGPRPVGSKVRMGLGEREDHEPRRNAGTVEVFEAFGMTKSLMEWSDRTGINRQTLRAGARKHGMEEYLRKKQWHPNRGF
jgi:hypothetical protein